MRPKAQGRRWMAVRVASPFRRYRHDPMFRSLPSPVLLLDEDRTVVAVNRSKLPMTGWREDDLVGMNVIDAFPERPGHSEPGVVDAFVESFERTLRTGRPQRLNALRYDVQDRRTSDKLIRKRWTVVTSAIRVGDARGVLCQVDDVTFLDENLVAAAGRHQQAFAAVKADGAEVEDVNAVLRALSECSDIASEAAQLREALRTRPVIEQAKGIIMADRRCGPEEAFDLLKRLSNDTNVRIAEVAAAVIYQRTH